MRRISHGEQHPCLHALLDWRDERPDMAVRIARHDEIVATLTAMTCGAEEAEALIREGVELVSTMYQRSAGSHCSCRVAKWYLGAMAELRAQAVRLCEGRYAVTGAQWKAI